MIIALCHTKNSSCAAQLSLVAQHSQNIVLLQIQLIPLLMDAAINVQLLIHNHAIIHLNVNKVYQDMMFAVGKLLRMEL